MQKRENSIAEHAAISTSKPRKPAERHPTATVLALVRKRPRAPASERPPEELSRLMPPQERSGSPFTEIFLGCVDTARARARQIISEVPPAGCIRIVEGWQQLADAQVQFTIRTLPR